MPYAMGVVNINYIYSLQGFKAPNIQFRNGLSLRTSYDS